MKTKHCIFVFVLLLIGSVIFPNSPRRIYFQIRNYSGKEVVINVEYWEDPIIVIYENPMTQEEIKNFMVFSDESMIPKSNETFIPIEDTIATGTVLKSDHSILDIVTYYHGDRIERLPFMEIMKAIFKKLEIVCDDGNRIITIGNLEHQIIKKEILWDRVTYILEIFDYDLEGKKASEW